MEINRVYILIFLVFIALTSCQKELTAEEYMNYVNNPENGLKKQVDLKKFRLSLLYEPTNYLIAKDVEKNNKSVDIEKLKMKYGSLTHFSFSIKYEGSGAILKYNETNAINENSRVNHFSFFAKDDFKVISNKDTSYCKLCIFSRNYNLKPTVDLSLVFDELNPNNDWKFSYSDSQFGLGIVNFVLSKENINNLPLLKK